MVSEIPHLTGKQVRAVVERNAEVEGIGFTRAAEKISSELGMGRRTLFDWMEKGLPTRGNTAARRALVSMFQKQP